MAVLTELSQTQGESKLVQPDIFNKCNTSTG